MKDGRSWRCMYLIEMVCGLLVFMHYFDITSAIDSETIIHA
jgi:hypothetical protein